MKPTRVYAVAAVLGVCGGLVGAAGHAALATDTPTPAPTPVSKEARPTVPHAKFRTAVLGWRNARAEVRSLRATLRHSPDFEVSLQLAAIAYGQDWRHLYRCSLSEGARRAERGDRHNTRPNSAGSGAYSSFQFMRSTFLSTPYARLDWSRQDVQAHAAAWMWASGRRGEWTGVGC